MKKETITLPGYERLPFSSAVRVGDMVYLSGHAGMSDDDGNSLSTIEGQTTQTLENIKRTLEAAGASLDNIVKVTCFLGDQKDFGKMNGVYLKYFKGDLPARSTCITGLAVPNMLLEVECIAYRPVDEG
jgi:2-iminobutanoate/2-iminopropanoate deaminase